MVGAVIQATDMTAAQLQASELETMRRHFVTTSRYEWMFWEMANGRER